VCRGESVYQLAGDLSGLHLGVSVWGAAVGACMGKGIVGWLLLLDDLALEQ
jgi:hypothetical protein